MKILLIGIGGFLGAIARFYTTKWTNSLITDRIPFGTVVVNVIGSFILGLVVVLSVEKLVASEDLRLFIGVGMLGAFTTFSTFSVETVYLLEDGAIIPAFVYIACNLFLSLLAAYGGVLLARQLV
ncbi:MAG: fluoride efflux transporter CrcB [Deferribacterales bacterium]